MWLLNLILIKLIKKNEYIYQCINILTGEIVSDNDDDEELEQARSEDSVEEDSDKIFFLKAQRAEILKGKFLFLSI